MSDRPYDPIDRQWAPVPDGPNDVYTSLDEILGLDRARCPECKARTRSGICLNACHLSARSYRKFMDGMRAISVPRGEDS